MPIADGPGGDSHGTQADRDQPRHTLWAAIRTLGADHVLYMRDDAIDLLPPGCSP
jgi:hypothetical protein